MKNQKTRLNSIFEYLAVGGSVFAMHFGGSSMIWPVTWGKESGSEVLQAFGGVFITALLLVVLSYVALSNADATLYQMLQKVSPTFAKIYILPTILVMGPLFLIPRMSAAAWDALVQVTGIRVDNIIITLIFSIVYYLITYWFISDPSGVIDRLSKVLVPILVVAVVFIIGKGLFNPIGERIAPLYEGSSFGYGFTGGYATGEVIAALLFGALVVNDLKNRDIDEDSINKNLIIVCSIGIGILTLTHLGHMIIGSYSATTFPELNYSALYTAVVVELWGKVGGIAFNIGLLFAALTTAVGLSASTSDLIVEVFEGRFDYKQASIFTLAISTVVATIGLTNIVEIIGPILDILYPAAITMVLFFSLYKNTENNPITLWAYKLSMVVTFIWGIIEGIIIYGGMFNLNVEPLQSLIKMVPGYASGMGYLTLVLIILIISLLKHKLFSNSDRSIEE